MKKAFTLAEVLITLGIIGVVAAMTLPALIQQNRNKELQTGLKKAYSVLQQAFLFYQAETGTPIIEGDFLHLGGEKFKSVLVKYMQVIEDCGTYGQETSNSSCMPNYPADVSKNYKNFNGTNYVNMECFDDGQFILSDGMLVMINTIGACPLNVSIDVNGYRKGPNRFGQDLFMFIINGNRLYPAGLNRNIGWGDMPCNKSSTEWTNGGGCTARALLESDFFKNLP